MRPSPEPEPTGKTTTPATASPLAFPAIETLFGGDGKLRQLFRDLVSMGVVPSDSEEDRTRKAILSFMAFLGFMFTVVLGIHDVIQQFPTHGIIAFGYATLTLIGFYHLQATKNYRIFRFTQLSLILVLPFVAQFAHGGFSAAGASMIWALGSPMCAVMFHGPRKACRWFSLFLVLLAIAAATDPYFTALGILHAVQSSPWYFAAHIGGISFCIFCIMQYFVYLLNKERQKSETLLLNVLPKAIAERLKQGNQTLADGFPEATILFADIAGFTTMSGKMTPGEVVSMLNRIFSDFDLLAEKHGLEKIKTIGDAYMLVGGLPTPRADHAVAVADMALAMQESIKKHSLESGDLLKIRIGINSGPVVAGVIGIRKFIYDLWGDAVNIASRMESSGEINRIQVSEDTWRLLKDRFEFEPRGLVPIKGKGEMNTWFLLGPKAKG